MTPDFHDHAEKNPAGPAWQVNTKPKLLNTKNRAFVDQTGEIKVTRAREMVFSSIAECRVDWHLDRREQG